jgi:nitroreductase
MIDILRTRRSIRKYAKRAVDAGSLEIIKEALLRSPSSRGLNPWAFVFVDDRDVLDRLSRLKETGSQFLKGAALGIVVCGDDSKSDTWIEDCAITSLVAHLTAHSLGLGSCWVQVRGRAHSGERTAEEYVQEVLGLPTSLRVESVIAVGFPAETKTPVPADRLDYGKIYYNRYGTRAG